MSYIEDVNELKILLEGKTISKIEKTNSSESICKFVLTDGSAFILYATDLGFWTSGPISAKGYESLNSLIYDYYSHAYNLLDRSPIINIDDDIVSFLAPDEVLFTIEYDKLSEWEKAIVNNPITLKILAESASDFGDVWHILFDLEYGCPKKLCWNDKK